MNIGILQTGRPPEELQGKYGNYDVAFERLLDGHGFEFSSWAALDGELPKSINDADGWLITGSRFGAYEPHDWIPPLENFLRQAYTAAVPIAGICFGHQILAQALGGTVEKYRGGWSVGRVEYQLDGFEQAVPLYAWHQDQVTKLPPEATVAGSTPFCKYAALAYTDKAYTVQPHPEFAEPFIIELLEARKDVLPKEIADRAVQSLTEGSTSSQLIADKIAALFKQAHRQA